MNKLVLLALVAGSLVLGTGCGATPGYSGKERGRLISRYWNYEGKQLNDDIDHVLYLRAGGELTKWHVQNSE